MQSESSSLPSSSRNDVSTAADKKPATSFDDADTSLNSSQSHESTPDLANSGIENNHSLEDNVVNGIRSMNLEDHENSIDYSENSLNNNNGNSVKSDSTIPDDPDNSAVEGSIASSNTGSVKHNPITPINNNHSDPLNKSSMFKNLEEKFLVKPGSAPVADSHNPSSDFYDSDKPRKSSSAGHIDTNKVVYNSQLHDSLNSNLHESDFSQEDELPSPVFPTSNQTPSRSGIDPEDLSSENNSRCSSISQTSNVESEGSLNHYNPSSVKPTKQFNPTHTPEPKNKFTNEDYEDEFDDDLGSHEDHDLSHELAPQNSNHYSDNMDRFSQDSAFQTQQHQKSPGDPQKNRPLRNTDSVEHALMLDQENQTANSTTHSDLENSYVNNSKTHSVSSPIKSSRGDTQEKLAKNYHTSNEPANFNNDTQMNLSNGMTVQNNSTQSYTNNNDSNRSLAQRKISKDNFLLDKNLPSKKQHTTENENNEKVGQNQTKESFDLPTGYHYNEERFNNFSNTKRSIKDLKNPSRVKSLESLQSVGSIVTDFQPNTSQVIENAPKSGLSFTKSEDQKETTVDKKLDKLGDMEHIDELSDISSGFDDSNIHDQTSHIIHKASTYKFDPTPPFKLETRLDKLESGANSSSTVATPSASINTATIAATSSTSKAAIGLKEEKYAYDALQKENFQLKLRIVVMEDQSFKNSEDGVAELKKQLSICQAARMATKHENEKLRKTLNSLKENQDEDFHKAQEEKNKEIDRLTEELEMYKACHEESQQEIYSLNESLFQAEKLLTVCFSC